MWLRILADAHFLSILPPVPKQKSHSGAKKRVRRTGSGKVVMKRHSRNHLLLQKNRRQKRLNRTLVLTSAAEAKMLTILTPHL